MTRRRRDHLKRSERKLQPLMTQTIDAFAPKLCCAACQSRCFHVRRFAEGDPQGRR